jgi:hypothetical protein
MPAEIQSPVETSFATPGPVESTNDAQAAGDQTVDLYTLVIDRMLAYCRRPRTAEEIAGAFSIEGAQARVWLARAVSEGALQKRAKPVRYVVATETLFTS